jgi:hypothetical protein
MASLIFGAVYLGHHVVVGHRREKQRVKNYERWEGLRDEYDEQKRTQRETRSLDLQRTGQYDGGFEERPILNLRDQQEADDARTSWRPQETFTPMHTGAVQAQHTNANIYQPPRGRPQSMDTSHMRAVSDMNGYSQHNATGLGIQPQSTGYQPTPMRALPAQKTGAWDDGLPQPLRISRHNFDESNSGPTSPNVGVTRTSSLRGPGSRGPPLSMTPRSPYAGSSESLSVPKRNNSSRSPSIPEERAQDVEPIQHNVPGGLMAELIEGFGGPGQQQNSSAPSLTSNGMPMAAPAPRPAPVNLGGQGEQDMEEWWKRKGPTAVEKDMQEWWR